MTGPAEGQDRRTRRPAAVRISTVPPAARPLQGEPAGLVSRVLAGTADFCVVVVVMAGCYLGVAALRFLWNSRTFTFPTAPFGVLLLLGSGVLVVYLAGAWVVTGRTYGDQLLGLRVVGPGGRRPRPAGALVRAVLYVLFPIGLFWVAVSRDCSSAQDLLLRYAVVYDWTQGTPEPAPAAPSDERSEPQ